MPLAAIPVMAGGHTMLIPESPTTQTLRLCSIHQTVEVLPGVWKFDRFFIRSRSQNYEIEEAACPTCLRTARNALKKQFPALYVAAPVLAQKLA
jgi:hypothetical protein